MIDILNMIALGLTIAFGLIGWSAPRYTMKKLDLEAGHSTLGLSEIRAASGALFVGAGIGALWLFVPAAIVMVGFMYGGAAVGRLTSIALDASGQKVSWSFLAAELVLAAWLLAANLPRI